MQKEQPAIHTQDVRVGMGGRGQQSPLLYQRGSSLPLLAVLSKTNSLFIA